MDNDRANTVLTAEQLASVRKVRLWHWRRVVSNRELQVQNERLGKGMQAGPARTACLSRARQQGKIADTHLRFVQLLNDVFPVGDTAERDDANDSRQDESHEVR